MKKLLLSVLLMGIVVFNCGYLMKESIEFGESQDAMVSMMQIGIRTDSRNTITGSVYGKEYAVTYYVNGNVIEREFSWK